MDGNDLQHIQESVANIQNCVTHPTSFFAFNSVFECAGFLISVVSFLVTLASFILAIKTFVNTKKIDKAVTNVKKETVDKQRKFYITQMIETTVMKFPSSANKQLNDGQKGTVMMLIKQIQALNKKENNLELESQLGILKEELEKENVMISDIQTIFGTIINEIKEYGV